MAVSAVRVAMLVPEMRRPTIDDVRRIRVPSGAVLPEHNRTPTRSDNVFKGEYPVDRPHARKSEPSREEHEGNQRPATAARLDQQRISRTAGTPRCDESSPTAGKRRMRGLPYSDGDDVFPAGRSSPR